MLTKCTVTLNKVIIYILFVKEETLCFNIRLLFHHKCSWKVFLI